MFKNLMPKQIYGFWLITTYHNIKWKIGESGMLEYYKDGEAITMIAYPNKKSLKEHIALNMDRYDYKEHKIRICRTS